MAETSEHKTWLSHFEAFEKSLNGQAASPIHTLRKTAITAFDRLGYPTSRDEAWKTVNLAPLSTTGFRPTGEAEARTVGAAQIEPFVFSDTLQLVFVNGKFHPQYSSLTDLPRGLQAGSLSTAMESDPDLVARHLGQHASFEELAFTALNTAFMQDGAWVHISRGAVIETPIHLLFISAPGEAQTVSHPRSLILAEENSQATIIETYAGPENAVYFTNAVTEIVAGEHAHIDHIKLEQESLAAIHVANHQSSLSRNSVVTSHAFTLGGRLVRNDVSSLLAGEACESTLNGFYVLGGDQHVDNYTLLEHAEPNSPSHELYKGVLGGTARAIFRGKIHVHQKAQKTDAYQSNQNLLLSDDARINTKPQLEIYADDVKCSHGATVGQLDETALFYLRSRGISQDTARQILLQAFAGDILERIKPEAVRERLHALVEQKLEQIQQAEILA